MTYCVITELNTEGEKEGNLYGDLIYYDKSIKKWLLVDNDGDGCGSCKNWKEINLPVFAIGEIILLDEAGREIGGQRRKPSKWFVDYKEFNSVEGAIECATQLTKPVI